MDAWLIVLLNILANFQVIWTKYNMTFVKTYHFPPFFVPVILVKLLLLLLLVLLLQ